MSSLKKALLWLWLLTKRLYKKPTFLVILALIPALVLGYSAMTRGDSGMLTVALAQEERDLVTEDIFASLQADGQLLRFRLCESPSEAETLVRTGKADAAWIFPGDLQTHIHTFVTDPDEDSAFITVLQREENVALMLARERLSGVLYEHLAQSFYISYIRENFPKMEHLSDEELLQYYHDTELSDTLFEYDHATAAADTQQVHYLMAPIRGLLAIVIVLCGLATAMYYIRDNDQGAFAWVPEGLRPIPELGCQLVANLNVSAMALLTLLLTGTASNIGLELLMLILYSLCVASFCMVLRALVGSIKALGTLMPLLIVLMLLICPVFFDLGALRQLQFLLPPTYYINGVHNEAYILYMLLYTLANGGVYLLLRRLFKRT